VRHDHPGAAALLVMGDAFLHLGIVAAGGAMAVAR
jgi:hypothetical protein